MKTIYLDMDGVLCDIAERIYRETQLNIKDLEESQVKDVLKNTPNFFRTMLPTEFFDELVEACLAKGVKVAILTSVGKWDPADVISQKKAWILENFGDVEFHNVYTSKEKAFFANENTLLIDDREKSLIPFGKAGGKTAKYENSRENIELIKKIIEQF